MSRLTVRTSQTRIATKGDTWRLDARLVQSGQARSRAQARELIDQGLVSVIDRSGNRLAAKASMRIDDQTRLDVDGPVSRFVSRGGEKLQHALDVFNVRVAQQLCLDAGQSTGGFTDYLLQSDAQMVVGIDVGHDQLSASLRSDERVLCLERINLREQNRASIAHACDAHQPALANRIARYGFDTVVADVSFISLTLVLPALVDALSDDGDLIALVKPQFELGRAALNKRGVVTDPNLLDQVRPRMQALTESMHLQFKGWTDSPITGGSGNREFLMHLSKRGN